MKAPDKVYVRKEKDNVIYSLSVQHNNGGEEYIRKDALLEWLESKVYQHNEDKFDDGFNTALGQVIDKLNNF